MPESFVADYPPESGWYFCTDNPDDPASTQLGYWDWSAKRFRTYDHDLHALLGDLNMAVSVWEWWEDADGKGFEELSCNAWWRGPQLWYGPIVPAWEMATAKGAGR